MEMEGLKMGLSQMFDWKLKIESFVSDRHIQIRAFLRDTYGPNRKSGCRLNPEIIHYLHAWHVANSK